MFIVYSFSQRRGILQGLFDKCSHLFICTSLKQTLSSGQKPVQSEMTKTEQITHT